LLTKLPGNFLFGYQVRTDKWCVADLMPGLAGCLVKQDKHRDKRCILAVLWVLTGFICALFPGSSVFADGAVQGLDPGFQSGVARQSRTQNARKSAFSAMFRQVELSIS